MPGTDYKVSLDTSGITSGLKTIDAFKLGLSSVSSLMSGDFVGAAQKARQAFIVLRTAMLANPFIAVAAAIASVAVALAGWAVRRQVGEMKDLTEATKKYREELEQLRGVNATPQERANKLALQMVKEGDSKGLAKGQKKAESEAIAKEQGAANFDAMAANATGIAKWTEKPRYEAEAARLRKEAEELRQAAQIYAEAQAELARTKAEESDKTLAAAREAAEAANQTDLARAMSGKSAEEKLNLKISDAERRLSESGSAYANAKTDKDRFQAATETESIAQELIALRDELRELNAAPPGKPATDSLASIKKQEADYALSKLSPQEQLAGINLRMKGIMGKKGWEQDAAAREEKLQLEKQRDDLQEKLRKDAENNKKDAPPKEEPPARSVTGASVEDRFDNYYNQHHGRLVAPRPVIRMAGSLSGGFVDSAGVRRMAGSTAGSFGDRLSKSSFAKTREELDARRGAIASAASAKVISRSTGDEQPVDIGMEALNYLETIAKNSEGI
jgi:hypothetical protein